MKPENVLDEWVDIGVAALAASVKEPPMPFPDAIDFKCLLAAVAPLIRRAALEEAAGVAETHEWFVGGIGTKAPGSGEAKAIAVIIRALT